MAGEGVSPPIPGRLPWHAGRRWPTTGPSSRRRPAPAALADGLGGGLGFRLVRVAVVAARVLFGRQIAAALGPGDQFVGGLALRDEAGLHAEVDRLRVMGDDRHRR